MIQVFAYVALFTFSLFTVVYGIYFLLITRSSKKEEYLSFLKSCLSKKLNDDELPTITILVPAYNEEKVISSKLQNIASFAYPHDKVVVIILDDRSTDKTVEIAERMLKELNITGQVSISQKRGGVNASYNRIMKDTTSDLVLMTDADVMIEPDALMNGVKILNSSQDIGGLSGAMSVKSSAHTSAVKIENSYRQFYDQTLLDESAVDSTYPAYTCLALVRTSIWKPLNESYGSSDGNLSLSIIAQGFKFLFVPQMVFHEKVATAFKEQRRQKVRRGTRLLQSTILYSKKLFQNGRRKFTTLIFPLRFLMMTLCPIAFWVGVISLISAAFLLSPISGIILLGIFIFSILLGTRRSSKIFNLFASFVFHQVYLLLAMILAPRKAKTWKAIERNAEVLPKQAP